jgi:predicted site-specific integrase-resolvase
MNDTNTPTTLTPPDKQFLTRKDTAARLAVSTETVKRWQHAGRLPAYVLSRNVVRYLESDICALAKLATAPASPA